jgi:hypothetical protein
MGVLVIGWRQKRHSILVTGGEMAAAAMARGVVMVVCLGAWGKGFLRHDVP